jgi:hypothetical protein
MASIRISGIKVEKLPAAPSPPVGAIAYATDTSITFHLQIR